MDISVLILTLDEEANLGSCLRSLAWCDDIVVFDSFSTDGTEEIARKAGARFVQRAFDDYASQRNFGLSEIEYKHPWVLMVDADEVVPPDLEEEIEGKISNCEPDVALFRMRRKDYLMGRWIRRSGGYPTWFGRLIRVGQVRVVRAINEEYHTDGKVRLLRGHLHHYPFNKGFGAWFEKHNRYSAMEATEIVRGGPNRTRLSDLWAKDPADRRRAVKRLAYALPARPLVVFLGLYVFRGGFLEGRAGLTFSALRAIYEFMIDCKVREFRRRKAGLPL